MQLPFLLNRGDADDLACMLIHLQAFDEELSKIEFGNGSAGRLIMERLERSWWFV